jgi:hypothetical protein
VSETPILAVVPTPFPADEATQVSSVTFSSSGLSVAVSSPQWAAKVEFAQTYGFRVLDELDLAEFWSQCSLRNGWFFEVEAKGWKDLELTRAAFQSGRQNWVREYLVVGFNECVSVLTKEDPVVVADSLLNPRSSRPHSAPS